MKSRIWLPCGALVAAIALSGCSAVGSLVQAGKNAVGGLTGANNPNDTSVLANMGRMQNAGTDAVAGAVGIKTDSAAPEAPAPVATPAPEPVAVAVAPPAPEPAASAAKKPVPKKVTAKPSSVKPVSTVPAKKK